MIGGFTAQCFLSKNLSDIFIFAIVISYWSLPIQVDTIHMEGIPVKMYKPANTDSVSKSKLNPCIVYFHGGGWTLFSVGVKIVFIILLP